MIVENVTRIKESLPPRVTLVAVSKTQPEQSIREVYATGVRDFGENKVQELQTKYQNLPKDICWHFIGHLQTNKVKYIAPFIHLIHGVDSLKLLVAINKEAHKCNRVISCLLQFHIAQEETKFGLSLDEALELLNSDEFQQLKHIEIRGVMGMASYVEDECQIRAEFAHLYEIFQVLQKRVFIHQDTFSILSMGMSLDYALAIEQGSSMVRIGTTIFGERTYK